MVTTLIHDVYGKRTVKNEEGREEEEMYLIKKNVSSPFFVDEFSIKAATPKHNDKGNRCKKQTIVITQEDSYVIKETFNDLMAVIEKGKPTKVGFRKNE